MRNSKLIKSFKISNSCNDFELSTGYEFDAMMKKLAKEVFDDENHVINESIAIGLLYDDNIFSDFHVKVSHLYFYQDYCAEKIAGTYGYEDNVEVIRYTLLKICKFLRQQSHLLQLSNDVKYEDLAISQFGKLALRLKFDYLTELKENTSVDRFILAVQEQYGREAFKDDFKSSRKVVRQILDFLEISKVAFFIDRSDASHILVYDKISEDKSLQLHRCISKIFDRDPILMKRDELEESEYNKIFDLMCDRDTELLYLDKRY